MTAKDVKELLNATVLTGEDLLDTSINSACGSDMMSDVLAFSKDHSVLLTGLCNQQVIRTAELVDIVCIVFVRNKQPGADIIELARERGMIVMTTMHRMFAACGLLYNAGVQSGNFKY